jgi:hypothetical protein
LRFSRVKSRSKSKNIGRLLIRNHKNLQEQYADVVREGRGIAREYASAQYTMSQIVNYVQQDLLKTPTIMTDAEQLQSQDPYTTIEFAKQILTPTDLSNKPLMLPRSQNLDIIPSRTKSPSKFEAKVMYVL